MLSFSGICPVLGLCWLLCLTEAVSFYGESYVHIPDENAFHETDLELRFKATRPYGILLLLVGSADYFLLQLYTGTIQLKVNYGNGETVLDMGRHRYDDLEWHDVKVSRSDDVITMTVDGTTTARKRIQGSYRDLNVHSIYLGGVDGNAKKTFEAELKNFRGALSQVVMNSVDLIARAKELRDPSLLVDVSFDVDEIFSASRDSPVSLLSDTSFISFLHIHPSSDRTASFMMQAQSSLALLLFSYTHHLSEKHYLALELINNRLRLTAAKNSEILTVTSDVHIGNGWHQIDISVNSEIVELSVDGVRKTGSFKDRSSALYGGLIYIGGIDHITRAVAFREGIIVLQGDNVLKGGLVGCIKNIVINSRAYNIHDIHASRLISTDCDKTKGENCTSAECLGTDSLEGGLEKSLAKESSLGEGTFADSSRDEFQFLSVRPVIVNEGESAEITSDNIEIVYDFKRFGIRESGIMIYVVNKPKFGDIEVDLGRRRNNDVFTYLDLLGKKVKYHHNGAENTFDEASFGLEIYSSSRADDDEIPEKLQQRYAFVLTFTINPTNDPPSIILSNGGLLRIIENTKIKISNEIMYAEDPDTSVSELTYLVTEPLRQGYFERSGYSGLPATQFTQLEVNRGLIWFVNLGRGDTQVTLKLSDGHASSDPVQLMIRTVELQLTVQRNTGLVLPRGSFAIISGTNLSTVSNVPSQDLEIRYEILHHPLHGDLERQQFTNGEWKKVTSFAQRHIDGGHVRYRQIDDSSMPAFDQFSFSVKAKSYITPSYYFRIQFEQVFIEIKANNELKLLHKPFGVLSSDNIRAATNNPHLKDSKVMFTIVRAPIHGDFYKVNSHFESHFDFTFAIQLGRDMSFSQQDINDGFIYYKLKSNTFEKTSDYTDLRVYTEGTNSTNVRLWIEFVPAKSDVRFINVGLTDVIEGGQKAIDRHSLYIQTEEFRVFDITVTSPPSYGSLQLVEPRSSAVLKDSVKEFTTTDIHELRLVYKHDDSEHDRDSFTFSAVPNVQRTSLTQDIPEFTGIFEIKMLMRNDNQPQRLVDKVFKVTRNGERLITLNDLAFTDPDIDYDTGELLYKRGGIPNGEIIQASTQDSVYNFKQKEIAAGEIMFRHEGNDKDTATLYVTDGQFFVNCLLEIEAGDPFVEITKNTGVIVNKIRGEVTVTFHNLTVETNVNVLDKDMRFVLTEEPKLGKIQVDGRNVNEFDLELLRNNRVVYKHTEDWGAEDSFQFAVVAGSAETEGKFSIEIISETVQLPPRVVHNRLLEVFTGDGKSIISSKHLLVTHPDVTDTDIEYLILVMPKYGQLYNGDILLTVDGENTFTQEDINLGHVTYELENNSATSDQFIFEVSTSYEALRGLEFIIKIQPYMLPFEVRNFTVLEGGKKALTSDIFLYDSDDPLEFSIRNFPSHGSVTDSQGRTVKTFTWEDVSRRNVFYVHDDSETKRDEISFTVSLLDSSQESEIHTIYITVEGVNDESPVIVKNEVLRVWRGSMTQITSSILCARDPDTLAEDLVYVISEPTNGHVSHLDNTFKAISSFRQSQLDDGQIVFVHEGKPSGEFSFQVSDGNNNKSPVSIFRIEARQLMLNIERNTLLNAYPNMIQPITASHLLTTTNDPNQTKPVIYTITSAPKHGSLVTKVKGNIQEVMSFNQADINDSVIYYRHSDQLNGWIQNDSFEFQVNTLYADPLSSNKFEVYISHGNINAENKDQLIKVSPLHVREGEKVVIASSNLDVSEYLRNLERYGKRVSLRFSLKDPPLHGKLLFHGMELTGRERFGQRDVYELIYQHDDSDTVFDTFNLTLHLRIEEQSLHGGDDKENMFDVVLNVSVQPVNDEPFRLLTTNPSLSIVQGCTTIINQSVLNTVDNDTKPEYIIYEIIREADNGHVAYADDNERKITNFSQHDVNVGRVVFVHKYYKESGAFYFRVSDGSHSPFYKSFDVHVSKVFINIIKNSTVEIFQSDTVAFITAENLNVSTNGDLKHVNFWISFQPLHGKIYVDNEIKPVFSQKDINEKRVMYKQTDLMSTEDYISISKVTYHYDLTFFENSSFKIYVRLKPLVVWTPLSAPRGERVALTSMNLDAGKLSEKTGDNPKYVITSGPFYGQILRKVFSKRQLHYESFKANSAYKHVKEFSHEDVVYMKVFYESDPRRARYATHDNFTYTLNAFNVQPAEGLFYIDLSPDEEFPMVPVTHSTSTQTSAETEKGDHSSIGEESVEPSRLKQNHVIILVVAIPLLIVIIVASVIVYFIWRGRRKRDYTPSSKKSPRTRPHISGPYQIEQPHVHIEPQGHESDSDESKSLVEYENTHTIPGTGRAQSEEADVVMPMLPPKPFPQGDMCIPRSPDISRTEVSSTVPTCKVTPLIDSDMEGAVGGEDEGRHSVSSMGDMIDWITNDPELLQHCSSSSPPVLRKSQYWL